VSLGADESRRHNQLRGRGLRAIQPAEITNSLARYTSVTMLGMVKPEGITRRNEVERWRKKKVSHKASRMPPRKFDPWVSLSSSKSLCTIYNYRTSRYSYREASNPAPDGRFDARSHSEPEQVRVPPPPKNRLPPRWGPVMSAGRVPDSSYPTRNTSCRLRVDSLSA
jgi:hypothetical protein